MKNAIAGLGLACLVALTGCGGTTTSDKPEASTTPTPSATPTPTASPTGIPAQGGVIKGTGYTFTMPKGWREVTKQAQGQHKVDRAAGARVPFRGFASNVNVVTTTGGDGSDDTLKVITDQILTAMKPSAPRYRALAPMRIDGLPAAHLAGLRKEGKISYWLEQYVVVDDDASYIISFSFSPKLPVKERNRLMSATLASWKVAA